MTHPVTKDHKAIAKSQDQENDHKTQDQTPLKKEAVWKGRNIELLVAGSAAIVSFAALALLIISELAKYLAEVTHDQIWKPDLPALEAAIKKKFESSFLDTLKKIPGLDYIRLCKHLAVCNKEEEEILKQLQSSFNVSDEQLKQILCGAHVRLKDGGKTYHAWVDKIESKQPRISSHASSDTQYHFEGPFIKEFIFSKIEEKGEVYTWFQLENHPVKFGYVIRHMLDYVCYKFTNHSQGPYGSSPITDSNPLVLTPRISV